MLKKIVLFALLVGSLTACSGSEKPVILIDSGIASP